jgi:hypothetical protein
VDSTVHALGVRALKKLVESSRERCDALVLEFEAAQTSLEKSRIAREYDKALKKTHAMQLLLELQERKEREAAAAEKLASGG